MLDLARDLLPMLREGIRTGRAERVAAVTVTHVARSAPRGVGATMAVTAAGRVIGSISGGCVESDAIALAHAALATGVGQRGRFGFSDETAHAAGLACGGTVEVLAYPVSPDPVTLAALEAAASDRSATVAIAVTGAAAGAVMSVPEARSGLEPARIPALEEALALRESVILHAAYGGEDLLVLSHAPRPRLLIMGAGEHAAALCRVGRAAGFAVTVCDPWNTLVTPERFPDADRLEVALPHEYLAALDPADLDARTAVCVLTHDERLDIPALATALRLPVGFVGAMGARSTVARRLELLRERGVAEIDLARIHSPLGLDLGGASPDETAISVLAEIVASRHGGSGRALGELDGPVHRRAPGSWPAPAAAGAAPAVAGAAPACGIPGPRTAGSAAGRS